MLHLLCLFQLLPGSSLPPFPSLLPLQIFACTSDSRPGFLDELCLRSHYGMASRASCSSTYCRCDLHHSLRGSRRRPSLTFRGNDA